MSSPGAAPRAAVPISNARAEASRKNGARSRGPKTPEGKARSAQNALKHGLRAQKYMVLLQEDAADFAALETAILAELAPKGALQTLLARRIAVAAWRLERADRLEAEVLEVRSYDGANPGVALIREANGTRSFETVGGSQHRLRWSVRSDQPLSRRGHGRVLACAAHPQGAPGRAGGRRHRAARENTCRAGLTPLTKRTQEGCAAPARLCHAGFTDPRPHAARARRALGAEPA